MSNKSDKLVTMRVPTDLYNRLAALASATYKSGSISRLVKYILFQYFNNCEVSNNDNE